MADEFIQGEDIPRTITLQDPDGNALDTADFLTIEVTVKRWSVSSALGTYTLAAGDVTKETPTSGGQITVRIPDSTTLNATTGRYDAEVKTTEVDADYDGGVRTRRGQVEGLFKLTSRLV